MILAATAASLSVSPAQSWSDTDRNRAGFMHTMSTGLITGFMIACGYTDVSEAEFVLPRLLNGQGILNPRAHDLAIGQAKLIADKYRSGGAPCDAGLQTLWGDWKRAATAAERP